MTPEQGLLLKEYDEVIEQAGEFKKFRGNAQWVRIELLLRNLRRQALERVLSGDAKQTREQLIGFAQCSNYLLNLLDTLVNEEDVAARKKEDLVQQIREEEKADEENASTMTYRGFGAI